MHEVDLEEGDEELPFGVTDTADLLYLGEGEPLLSDGESKQKLDEAVGLLHESVLVEFEKIDD